jgi:hypothetical protein
MPGLDPGIHGYAVGAGSVDGRIMSGHDGGDGWNCGSTLLKPAFAADDGASSHSPSRVMPGLDPGIHGYAVDAGSVDGRITSGHDGGDGWSYGSTPLKPAPSC